MGNFFPSRFAPRWESNRRLETHQYGDPVPQGSGGAADTGNNIQWGAGNNIEWGAGNPVNWG